MAVHIRQLVCRITVRGKRTTDSLHRGEQPQRPSMAFLQPEPPAQMETPPIPSQTATEQSEHGTEQLRKPSPSHADPRAVADRVYDFMKEELSIGRLRGKPW
ncbi:MAG: hypothetical protein ACYDCO_00630 [Armatimonadota bacterium]